MKVAAIQHDIVWEDPSANFVHLAGLISEAAAQGARLAVLTEMYSTGFSMAAERIAEPAGGRSSAFLVEQAARNDLWVCGSLPEVATGATRPSNCLVLAGPDGTILRYRKIHPFSFAGEHHHYEAGDKHVTVMVEGVRLSLFVCYDLRFGDEFWPLASDTDCYVVVANWPASRRCPLDDAGAGARDREPGLRRGGEPRRVGRRPRLLRRQRHHRSVRRGGRGRRRSRGRARGRGRPGGGRRHRARFPFLVDRR